VGLLAYDVATRGMEDSFSEFYVLGPLGTAGGYPKVVRAGREAGVLAGVVNHEGRPVSYRIQVQVDGAPTGEAVRFTLADGERWEGDLGFTAPRPCERCKVELLLYEDLRATPILEPLRIWVTVVE